MLYEVITRAQAKERGLTRYFTNRPCKNQHIAQRYTGRGTCCECNLAFARKSYDRNPEFFLERSRRRRKEQPEKIREVFRRWYDAWMISSPGASVEKTRRWLKNHPNYRKEKRKNDPNFHIADTIRARVRYALFRQGATKSASTFELIGCSRDELRIHLESNFLIGMSWDNYGYGHDKWHIDHIRPIASFNDLSDPAQQRACFHFTNLQPLWQPDNFRKGARFDAQPAAI